MKSHKGTRPVRSGIVSAMALIVGLFLGMDATTVHCPSEDSCRPEYVNPDGVPANGDEYWAIVPTP